MKIFGIGTDIVNTNRIKRLVQKKYFISRIFNKNEIIKCKKIKNSHNCFAKLIEKRASELEELLFAVSKNDFDHYLN